MMMSMNSSGVSGAGGGGGGGGVVGPVARWLDTIVSTNMCKQYVEVFKRYGYATLQDVCKLESHQLAQMGVTNSDNEKIMENVSVLRQTLKANVATYKAYAATPPVVVVADTTLDQMNKLDVLPVMQTPNGAGVVKPSRKVRILIFSISPRAYSYNFAKTSSQL